MVVHIGGEPCETVTQVARLLEVTPQQVRDLVRAKKLRRVGEERPILISLESVREYGRGRGPWRRFGVIGGRQAAERLGVWREF